tara:strand:- start:8241 stop:8648 length:408 start_codon:yes stop_codon:yes gene_type:complete
MKLTKQKLKQIIKEELWKVSYNKKGERRAATGVQEKGKYSKEVEAPSASEATIDITKAGHHIVSVTRIEEAIKELLGMDQEVTGEDPEVAAENALMAAIQNQDVNALMMAIDMLKAENYTPEDILNMVQREYQSD